MAPKSLKPNSSGQDSSDSSTDASSEEDSDDDSGTDEETEPQPVLITQPRPSDAAKAMEWDIVKAVWSLRKMPVSGAAIRTALGKYWELWKPLRDAWKTETAAVTAAEAKGQKAITEHHKGLANEKRKLLDGALIVKM